MCLCGKKSPTSTTSVSGFSMRRDGAVPENADDADDAENPAEAEGRGFG